MFRDEEKENEEAQNMSLTPLETAEKYFRHYNAHEFIEIGDVLGEDIEVVHYNRGFTARGKDQMLGLYAAADESMGDRKFVNQVFYEADGNRVISQATFTGKNLVDTPFGAAGTDYSVDLCTILTVQDGKVVKYEDYG